VPKKTMSPFTLAFGHFIEARYSVHELTGARVHCVHCLKVGWEARRRYNKHVHRTEAESIACTSCHISFHGAGDAASIASLAPWELWDVLLGSAASLGVLEVCALGTAAVYVSAPVAG